MLRDALRFTGRQYYVYGKVTPETGRFERTTAARPTTRPACINIGKKARKPRRDG